MTILLYDQARMALIGEQTSYSKLMESPQVELFPETSNVLAEVSPGIVALFGELPTELELEPIKLDFIKPDDYQQLTAKITGIVGEVIGAAGNIAQNTAPTIIKTQLPIKGLYRLSEATESLLAAHPGATLSVAKDGSNLGSIISNGKIVAQARLIPHETMETITTVTSGASNLAGIATALGPALAMMAIQQKLDQISNLIEANIDQTREVLQAIRHDQWSDLISLTRKISRVLSQAKESNGVPQLLWNTIQGSEDALEKNLDLYRLNTKRHIEQIAERDGHRRRAYLEENAEAILFDSQALLHSLKSWSEFQLLKAVAYRDNQIEGQNNQKLIEVTLRDAQVEYDNSFAQAKKLLDALNRELHIIAELPGRKTLPLSKKRKDLRTSQFTCAQLLEVVDPMVSKLHLQRLPQEQPRIVCSPAEMDIQPYLKPLWWMLADDEPLKAFALALRRNSDKYFITRGIAGGTVGLFTGALSGGLFGGIPGAVKGAKEGTKWAAQLDDYDDWATAIAVTDSRILISRAKDLRLTGAIKYDIPLSDIRYVTRKGATVEVKTKAFDHHWAFPDDYDIIAIKALTALFAHAMNVPEAEYEQLLESDSAAPEIEK